MPVVVGSCCLDEYVDQRAMFRTVEWEISWELVNHYIKKMVSTNRCYESTCYKAML